MPYFAPKVVPSDKLTRTSFAQSKRLWRLSPTRTPNAHIEFVYLIKPTSDALIKSLATNAASHLRNYLPRTHPCRVVTPKTIKNDASGHFSSLFISLQAHLSAKGRSASQVVIEMVAKLLHLWCQRINALQTPLVRPAEALSEEPAFASPPSIPSPPILPCATPSSIVSIMTCKDSDCPWRLISILAPFSALHATRQPAPGMAPLPSAVDLRSDCSTASSDGTPSMLPHTTPLPFTDDLKPRSLSTSMNGFQLDDLTTKSIVAYNRIHSHHSQREK